MTQLSCVISFPFLVISAQAGIQIIFPIFPGLYLDDVMIKKTICKKE